MALLEGLDIEFEGCIVCMGSSELGVDCSELGHEGAIGR
jgi:hypothetical protein